eukprot:m.1561284 g.1561284  ORF g.1561284 m.1561284 type:complete len:248 (-) comp25277_c0_seq74:2637-3380(-)
MDSTLDDMFETTPLVYYERLEDCTAQEMYTKTFLSNVSVLDLSTFTFSYKRVYVNKNDTIADVVRVAKKLPGDASVAQYRVLDMLNEYTIFNIVPLDSFARDFERSSLRIEAIPEDQTSFSLCGTTSSYISSGDPPAVLLQVVHMHNSTFHMHGVPFWFRVVEGESFDDMLARLQAAMHVTDKDVWTKLYAVGILSGGQWTPINDLQRTSDTITLSQFRFGVQLCIDHKPDKKRNRTSFDVALKIDN